VTRKWGLKRTLSGATYPCVLRLCSCPPFSALANPPPSGVPRLPGQNPLSLGRETDLWAAVPSTGLAWLPPLGLMQRWVNRAGLGEDWSRLPVRKKAPLPRRLPAIAWEEEVELGLKKGVKWCRGTVPVVPSLSAYITNCCICGKSWKGQFSAYNNPTETINALFFHCKACREDCDLRKLSSDRDISHPF
jgi:hypothetical protein